MLGLTGLVAYVVMYDVFAITRRRQTISSACWGLQCTPLRRACFFVGWAVLTRHLWGPTTKEVA